MMKQRTPVTLFLVIAVTALAMPAQAASVCSTSGSISESSDIVDGVGTMDCTGDSRLVEEMRIEIQEKVGSLWNTRDSEVDSGLSHVVYNIFENHSCAGHGTDKWRVKVIGIDNTGDSDLIYRPSTSGTSLTCST